jgi:hypothetical protein
LAAEDSRERRKSGVFASSGQLGKNPPVTTIAAKDAPPDPRGLSQASRPLFLATTVELYSCAQANHP